MNIAVHQQIFFAYTFIFVVLLCGHNYMIYRQNINFITSVLFFKLERQLLCILWDIYHTH